MTLPLAVEENYLETAITVQVLTSQALFTLECCYSNSTLHTWVCSYRKQAGINFSQQWTTSHTSLIPSPPTIWPHSQPTHHLASFPAHPPPGLIPIPPHTQASFPAHPPLGLVPIPPHTQASFPAHPPPGLVPSQHTTWPHAPSTTKFNAESQRIRLTHSHNRCVDKHCGSDKHTWM